MSFLPRAPRPTAAAAAAVVCFTAGVAAGAIYDQDRVDRAVSHARSVAAEVAENREALEASLARAEAASAEAAALAATDTVAAASAQLATSADAAARAAEQHRIALETPSLPVELPVPLAVDGSAAATPRSVLGAPDETVTGAVSHEVRAVGFADAPAAASPDASSDVSPEPSPEAIAEVVDDAEVRQVLDGDVSTLDEAHDAARRLEDAAADLEAAAADLDRTTLRLARATAEVVLERDRASLGDRLAAAPSAVASAREDVAAVEDRVLDASALDAVRDAAAALETAAAADVDLDDADGVARLSTDLAAADRALESALTELRSTHAAWVSQENARRALVNDERRSDHDAAVAEAEQARTAAYRAAVASHQDGWSGAPAGMTYRNGRLPSSALCPLPFAPEAQLSCDAAIALTAADDAYHAQTGRHLEVLSSYRSYAAQVSTRAARSSLAATPGTSNHGWGMAIDLGNASAAWLRSYGADYGWVHPAWARSGGSKPESWHLEFVAPGTGRLEVAALELLEPVEDLLAP